MEIQISSLLDIGAHVGTFTKKVLAGRDTAPVRCHMIEANEMCEPYLASMGVPYTIALLGETHFAPVTYWMTTEVPTNTGNSYYKEHHDWYGEGKGIPVPRITKRLDTILNGEVFDFIKIDTQGSELDILRGGPFTLSHAKHVLMEVSIEEYNEGAPLKEEVVRFMTENGFTEISAMDIGCNQQDVLFSRPGILNT